MFGRTRALAQHTPLDLLSAYLDGQVSPQERDQVDQHLRACPACAGELEALRYTTTLLHAMPQASLPRAYILSEAAVGRSAARRPLAPLAIYLQGAAALVAALLLVVIVGDSLHLGARRGVPMPAAVQKSVVETAVVEVQVTAELLAAPMAAPIAAQAPAAEPEAEAVVAEAEMPQELLVEPMATEAAAEDFVAAAEPLARAAAKVAEPEIQELPATPFGAPLGMGAGAEETLLVEAAAVRTDEATTEAAIEDNLGLPQATLAPEPMVKQAMAPTEPTAAPEAMLRQAPAPAEATPAPEATPQEDWAPTAAPVVAEAAVREAPPPAAVAPATQALAEKAAVVPAEAAATAMPESLAGTRQPAAPSWWTTTRLVEVGLAVLLAVLVGLSLWLRRWPTL